ncbi:MAG: transcriptional repressor [Planctomycetota bacterium]|nr:MAG: transcriptional repressor [Planctomycetota bacterium]
MGGSRHEAAGGGEQHHAEALRRAGLHVTAQRLAVLQAVAEHPHLTAEEAVGHTQRALGAISRQAVYDALNTLVERGLIRRIQPMGSPARYEDRIHDNHHHLICRRCGRVEDVDCAVGRAPCLQAAQDHGYRIEEAEVIYWGTCPQCLGARSPEHAR